MKKTLFATAVLFSQIFIGTSHAAEGLRAKEVVLKGALIRAGGPSGKKSLPEGVLQGMCNEGISTAVYLYPTENFSTKGSYSCANGNLIYKGGGFRGKDVIPVLEEVYSTIKQGRGPVLVHCWNGWHAAGEVAAVALKQFCGWSGDDAADYWTKWIAQKGDKSNLHKYKSIPRRIREFQPRSDLQLTAAEQAKICP